MRICLLAVAISVLIGCATRPDPGVTAAGKAALDNLKATAIAQWGPEQNWTPEQRLELYNAEIATAKQFAEAAYPTYTPTPLPPQYVPVYVTQPYQPTPPPSSGGLGIRTWHNSDGSSGSYVPDPGTHNGGTIFNSDGTTTQVDPAIGH